MKRWQLFRIKRASLLPHIFTYFNCHTYYILQPACCHNPEFHGHEYSPVRKQNISRQWNNANHTKEYSSWCLNIMICPFLFILLVSLFPRSPFCCDSLPILLPYFPLPFSFAFIYLLLCFYSLPFIFVWAKGPISIYPGSTIHCGYFGYYKYWIHHQYDPQHSSHPLHILPLLIALANSNYK